MGPKTLAARIPEYLRTPTWIAFSTRARVIVYAKDAVNPADVQSYEALADPILLGNPEEIQRVATEMDLDIEGIRVVNPEACADLERYVQTYWELRRRKGVTLFSARKSVARERKLFGMLMVHLGDADGCVSGQTASYSETIRPALQVIGLAPGYTRAAGMYMMVKGQNVLFCADTTVNETPDANVLAEIAIQTANAVWDLGVKPRIAMLSYSNFGSAAGEESCAFSGRWCGWSW